MPVTVCPIQRTHPVSGPRAACRLVGAACLVIFMLVLLVVGEARRRRHEIRSAFNHKKPKDRR